MSTGGVGGVYRGPRTNVYKPGFQCDVAMALNKKKNIIIVTHYMLKIIKRDSMMTLKREIFFYRT